MDFNYTLIGQLLAFILFVWFCMRFIWPQLLEILETREKEISDGLEAASRGKRELEDANTQRAVIVDEAKKVRLGDPMHGQTDMGPMVSIMQLKKSKGKVERAKAEGARLLCGGNQPKEFNKGYFYSPTVFDQVTSEMEMMNIETFGPIIPIQKVKNLEEAIELANNSQYGLGCNIYTNDMEKALTAAEDIKAGSFWINDPLTDNEAAPFGGMKMSGGGRELGIEGLDEFRESKHILIDYQIREKDYWFPYDLDEGRKT